VIHWSRSPRSEIGRIRSRATPPRAIEYDPIRRIPFWFPTAGPPVPTPNEPTEIPMPGRLDFCPSRAPKFQRSAKHFMPKYLKTVLATLLTLSVTIGVFAGPNRAAVVQRVREELAMVLKKDVAQIPVDESVLELGAEDFDVIEWVSAVEEELRVTIPDEKVFDQKTNTIRKDLSVLYMADLVIADLNSATKQNK
jgi:acyl carrier protein